MQTDNAYIHKIQTEIKILKAIIGSKKITHTLSPEILAFVNDLSEDIMRVHNHLPICHDPDYLFHILKLFTHKKEHFITRMLVDQETFNKEVSSLYELYCVADVFPHQKPMLLQMLINDKNKFRCFVTNVEQFIELMNLFSEQCDV